jgi:prepilin-type N-terminal cleavage/methylation domain-containing protein
LTTMKKTNLNFTRFLPGFTLLELMVVIVLVGFLIAIAIPTLRSLSGASIKNEVIRISGLASEVYAHAAISGITHRVNFDLDEQNYWVEKKVEDAGTVAPELGYEELMKERISKITSDEEKEKVQRFLPNFKAAEGELGEKHQLDTDLVLYGAWTEHMEEVSRTGIVSVYFFSGGYTQSAFISIAKKGEEADSSMYVALSPLTGAVEIDLGEPDINQLLESEKEK